MFVCVCVFVLCVCCVCAVFVCVCVFVCLCVCVYLVELVVVCVAQVIVLARIGGVRGYRGGVLGGVSAINFTGLTSKGTSDDDGDALRSLVGDTSTKRCSLLFTAGFVGKSAMSTNYFSHGFIRIPLFIERFCCG